MSMSFIIVIIMSILFVILILSWYYFNRNQWVCSQLLQITKDWSTKSCNCIILNKFYYEEIEKHVKSYDRILYDIRIRNKKQMITKEFYTWLYGEEK